MKKITYFSLTITLIFLFNSSILAFQKKSPHELTQQELNDQSLLAINWVQQSGEYQALTYQAYNIAKVAFDNAVQQNITNPAVVIDIDETVLDNSPYQASLINTNNEFSSNTWNQWVMAEKAQAIPGAVEFINYVNSNGGTVFFISNRDESSTHNSAQNDLELATINNLHKLEITGVSEETVLLKGEFTKIIDGQEHQGKQWREQAITKGLANGIKYNIVMLVGDNLNDFAELEKNNNDLRKKFVQTTKNQQGIFLQQTNQETIKPA
jgi:5'-nucleotidase (lipoprotein e(P4) family)